MQIKKLRNVIPKSKKNPIPLRIKYLDPHLPPLEHIGGKNHSNWIDVRVTNRIKINGTLTPLNDEGTVTIPQGAYVQVYLGFALELPEGYEADVRPRSSTFKATGLLQTNSAGVIDTTYCGNEDEWFVPFYATREATLTKYDRIAQFRIQEVMPEVEFVTVHTLGNKNRRGHGSTGK